MSTVLQHKVKTSRKEHKCDYCEQLIMKDVKYDSTSLVCDGSVYTWKNHIHCQQIAHKLKMFDDHDEGVTSDTFQEYINQEFHEINTDELSVVPDFKGRLEYVLNWHAIEL